ncbi:MAG: bifunctional DNA primase/polymerase [Phycisphaerales bacterium]
MAVATANGMLDTAIRYAELGYAVFPCRPGDKRPLTPNGLLDATTDPAQIEQWWSHRRSANVAIRTDGLLVIDIDGADNPWLADEPEQQLELSAAPISVTPRGGRHLLFRAPEGKAYRNSTGKLAERVDVRADGGYILVAPSTVLGKPYHWPDGFELDASPDQLPEPPNWLLEALDKIDTRPAGGATLAHVVPGGDEANPIPDGQRNTTLASLGGSMRRVGMSQAEILAALVRVNDDRCKPPLPPAEIERIAQSVARYEPDTVAVAVAENHWSQDRDAEEHSSRPDDPGPFPDRFLDVPGFVAEVMEHNLATATRPQPVLALAGALCLQAVLAARKVRDERGNRTNLYCIGVAPSGAGKDHARKVNKNILFAAGLVEHEGSEDLASDAGLVTAVEAEPAILFQIDEFGRFLRTIGDPKKAPHLFNVLTVLMKLFSSADTVFRGKAYADKKRNKVIDQPCVCVYGTTVPEHFFESLTAESLADGFVARMLVFETPPEPPPRQRSPQRAVPEPILEAARWWGDFKPGGNLRSEHPEPHIVPTTPEGAAVFDCLARLVDERLSDDSDVARAMWARAEEKACRLALVYACSANRKHPSIDEAAATWACDLSEYLTRRMLHVCHEWVAEGQFDARQKRVLRIVRRADGTISRTDLCRKTQWLTQRERQEVVNNLLETGQLCESKEATATRPRVIYALA